MTQHSEQSNEQEKQEFILRDNEAPRSNQYNTLLKRYYTSGEEQRFSCEVWSPDSESNPKMVCYLSDKLHKDSLEDSWKFFKKIWTDKDYWKYIQDRHADETVH